MIQRDEYSHFTSTSDMSNIFWEFDSRKLLSSVTNNAEDFADVASAELFIKGKLKNALVVTDKTTNTPALSPKAKELITNMNGGLKGELGLVGDSDKVVFDKAVVLLKDTNSSFYSFIKVK